MPSPGSTIATHRPTKAAPRDCLWGGQRNNSRHANADTDCVKPPYPNIDRGEQQHRIHRWLRYRAFVTLEVSLEIGQTPGFKLLPREIRFWLHDLTRGSRRITERCGKRFLFPAGPEQFNLEIQTVPIGKC